MGYWIAETGFDVGRFGGKVTGKLISIYTGKAVVRFTSSIAG
jgi:hypothetical protein